MRKLKIFVSGIVIGGLVGLWFGVNIGKGQPVYANPLTQTPVSTKLQNAGRQAVNESGEALEKAGQKLKQKASGQK